MANLSPIKNQFFNSSGVPLAGGLIYTYAAGTSAPQVTYSDQLQTTPNTNPVVLDARGEANIWLDGSYRIVVADSLGVQIYAVDNITSAVSASGIAVAIHASTAKNPIAADEFGLWDSVTGLLRKVTFANLFLQSIFGYATTATATTTTTLTALSPYQQYFTGGAMQTVIMPVSSTCAVGQSWLIDNNSTGIVTVQSSGGNQIVLLNQGDVVIVTCVLAAGTTAASWDIDISAQRNGDSAQVFSVAPATAAGHAVRLGQINSTTVPSFSAWQSSAQTVTTSAETKINFQTKEWDTTTAFDNVTNMRFTPQVAGYYQVNAALYPNTTITFSYITVFKNGSAYKRNLSNSANQIPSISCLVPMNGTTDYIEIYAYLVGTTPQILNSQLSSYFQAALVFRA